MKKVGLLCMGVLLGVNAVAFAADEVIPEYSLEIMNVTASGYEKSNLETPADVTVYTAEDLAKTGATNVSAALKYKAGIYATQMGPHGQNWITNQSKSILRGVDNGTLVLLNGVPTSFNGVSHLDTISLDQVERVEVVKGGGAVLYGSEAFGGVINIITKKQYNNKVHFAAGNKGQRNYSVAVNAKKLDIYAGHDEYGSTENMSVNPSTNSSVWGSGTKYRISFGKSKKDTVALGYAFNDKVRLDYTYHKKDYSINYNAVQGLNGRLQHFDYDDQEHYAQLAYNNKDFSASAYYNYRDLDNPDYRLVKGAVQREWEVSKQKVYGFNVKQAFGGGSDRFLLGASYKHEIWQDEREKFANATGAVKYKNDSFNSNDYSIYGQYDKKLSNASNFIISAREEIAKFNGDNYHQFLPQAQFITRFDDENAFYVSAGKSFRMPHFRNLYYSSGMITPNPDLKPEKGKNYEVGYKFDAGDSKVNIALFRTEIKDQIASESLGNNVSRPINVSEYKNQGVEVRYERDLNDHWSYNAGAIFSKPQRRYAEGQDWIDALGRYQINGGINYNNRDTEVAFNFSYWGDRVTNGSTGSGANKRFTSKEIDGPLVISSLHVGHKLKDNLKLNFDIENLFNREDICNADTSSSLYYTAGRTFLIGVDYSF